MRVRIVFAVSTIIVAGSCGELTRAAPCDESTLPAPSFPMLEVKFVEALRIRGCALELHSETGENLRQIRAVFRHVGVTTIRPSITVPQHLLDSLYADAPPSNEPHPDLLSWHRLSLAPSADVDAAIAELSKRREIEFVYRVSEIVPPPP
ncbi:MAG TPA: hypothetical protein VJ755_04990 [Gemmatimonadales bacterium]|nr:hypothetical protein [Gemmatimonadales bacterium]